MYVLTKNLDLVNTKFIDLIAVLCAIFASKLKRHVSTGKHFDF